MKRKKISVASLIALSPTLFAMVREVPVSLSPEVLIPGPSAVGSETGLEPLPRYIQCHLIYLSHGVNVHIVVKNVVNYLKTLGIDKTITHQQLQPVVKHIATQFVRSPLDVLLLFYGSGIPAAKELLDRTPRIHEQLKELVTLGDFWEYYDEAFALPIFMHDPSLALDPNILVAAIKKDSPNLIRFLVQRPELRDAFTKRGPLGEYSPLAMAFPLVDAKTFILAEAFDLRTLIAAGKQRFEDNLIYPDVAQDLLPYVIDKPDDLIILLSLKYNHEPYYWMGLKTRNEQGETVLMKLIEYRKKYTNSDAALADEALRFLIDEGDINAVDGLGETALIKAIKNEDLEAIGLLLRKGANVLQTDNKGMSAFDCARGKPAIEQLLIAKDASLKQLASQQPDQERAKP